MSRLAWRRRMPPCWRRRGRVCPRSPSNRSPSRRPSSALTLAARVKSSRTAAAASSCHPGTPKRWRRAMEAMMACSEKERRQMGAFGRKHIERDFALDRVLGCWSGLLNDLVGAVASMSTRPRLVNIVTVPISFWLIRGWAALMSSAGFDVHAISSPGPLADEYSREQNVPVHPVPMARRISPWSDLVCLARLVATLKRLRPRVVQAGTPKAGLLGMIAAYFLRVPIRVYYIHGLPMLTARGLQRLILLTTERLACAMATHVVCVSHSIRRRAGHRAPVSLAQGGRDRRRKLKRCRHPLVRPDASRPRAPASR